MLKIVTLISLMAEKSCCPDLIQANDYQLVNECFNTVEVLLKQAFTDYKFNLQLLMHNPIKVIFDIQEECNIKVALSYFVKLVAIEY